MKLLAKPYRFSSNVFFSIKKPFCKLFTSHLLWLEGGGSEKWHKENKRERAREREEEEERIVGEAGKSPNSCYWFQCLRADSLVPFTKQNRCSQWAKGKQLLCGRLPNPRPGVLNSHWSAFPLWVTLTATSSPPCLLPHFFFHSPSLRLSHTHALAGWLVLLWPLGPCSA